MTVIVILCFFLLALLAGHSVRQVSNSGRPGTHTPQASVALHGERGFAAARQGRSTTVGHSPSPARAHSGGNGLGFGASGIAAPSRSLPADSKLGQILAARQVFVQTVADLPDQADAFDRTAQKMGDNYEVLAPLYHQIRRTLFQADPLGGLAHIKIGELPAASQQRVYEFVKALKALGMVRDEWKNTEKGSLSLRLVQPQPAVRQFLTGGWLERYVAGVVRRVLADQVADAIGQTSRAETYATLRYRSVEAFGELDVLARIDDTLVWCECKSGQWTQDVSRYAARRRELGVSSELAFLVLLRADEDAKQLASLNGIRVVGIDEFSGALRTTLQARLGAQAELDGHDKLRAA